MGCQRKRPGSCVFNRRALSACGPTKSWRYSSLANLMRPLIILRVLPAGDFCNVGIAIAARCLARAAEALIHLRAPAATEEGRSKLPVRSTVYRPMSHSYHTRAVHSATCHDVPALRRLALFDQFER